MELFLVALVGACFGSFVTLASYRLPRDEKVAAGRSKCTSCAAYLGPLDLVPIFSWLFSMGKCRHCKAKVGYRYPATEIATSLAFMALYYMYGPGKEFFFLAGLAVCVMILIVSDFETYIIPDEVQIAMLIMGIWYKAGRGEVAEAMEGFALYLLIALLLRYGFYFAMKREGLGMGDVKFLAVAGLWMGMAPLPVFLFLAGILGIATAIAWKILHRHDEFPFGPALAASLMLCLIFPSMSLILNTPQ